MPKREFVLTNGTKFIKQDADGKYKQTTSIGLADIYDSLTIADNIRINSIPKSLSRAYRVAEIVNGEIVQIQAFVTAEKIRTGETIYFDNSYWNNEWCNSFAPLEGILKSSKAR